MIQYYKTRRIKNDSMNNNFEYILEQNAIFLNIVKKSMIDNFTESEFVHETVKKFEEDMKAKSLKSLFSVMHFSPIAGTMNQVQNVCLLDKKGFNWNFRLNKYSVNLESVCKIYDEYLVEHDEKGSYVKLNKADSIINFQFIEPVINKELIEIAEITTDFDIKKLLGISVESFKFYKEKEDLMEKNKNKTVADTMKYKIKRLFS